MSIPIVSVKKAIKIRAYAYYAASRLIIEYSEAKEPYGIVSLTKLNNIFKEFIDTSIVDTNDLEEMIAKILGVLQYFYRAGLGMRISLAETVNQLSHAEHVYNWLFREKNDIEHVFNIIDKDEIQNGIKEDILQTIEHIPLAKFNDATQDEWLKIKLTKEEQPKWFSILHLWEQRILTAFIDVWLGREDLVANNINDAPSCFEKFPANVKKRLHNKFLDKNNEGTLKNLDLGEFLGVQTGHLSCYPSIRNGYRVMLCIYKKSISELESIELIRKVTLLRAATPFVNFADADEQLRITIANIQQAILFDLVNPFQRIAHYSSKRSVITVPVLIQNLVSHHKGYDDAVTQNVMIKAVRELRGQFADRQESAIFLKKNIEQLKDIVKRDTLIEDVDDFLHNVISNKRVVFDICFASHDVFQTSFIRKKQVPFSQDRQEHSFLKKVINAELMKLLRGSVYIGSKPAVKSKFYHDKLKKAIEDVDPIKAMHELSDIHDEIVEYKIPALKLGLDAYELYLKEDDASFYQAAYLQITFAAIGIRIGGCSNGCDFESPLILVVNAMRIFYVKYGCFPGHSYLTEKEYEDFEQVIASEFLQGYCHNLLERSSQGCSGVIFLEKTLGDSVLNKIKKLAPKYGINPNEYHFYHDAETLSRIEFINESMDLVRFEKTIHKSISETKELKKSREWDVDEDCKLYNKLLPTRAMIEKNRTRLKAEEKTNQEIINRIEEMFNIGTLKKLNEEIERASKTTPLKATFSKIMKFKKQTAAKLLKVKPEDKNNKK